MISDSKVILFDLDGTLVRTGGAGLRALSSALKDLYGMDPPLDGITIAGNTDPNIFREIIRKKISGSPPTLKEEGRFFEKYLYYLKIEIESSPGYRILPGTLAILEAAQNHKHLHTGLGTGNIEMGARIKLERGGLNPFLAFGGFGSDSSDRPQMLRMGVEKAQKLFGVIFQPHQVYIVGDTPLDISAARTMGAQIIAVATGGYTSNDLRVLEPDLLLENLSDMNVFFEFISQT